MSFVFKWPCSKKGYTLQTQRHLKSVLLAGHSRVAPLNPLKNFKKNMQKDILSENGKTEKTNGYAGPKTLAKLNELYGE